MYMNSFNFHNHHYISFADGETEAHRSVEKLKFSYKLSSAELGFEAGAEVCSPPLHYMAPHWKHCLRPFSSFFYK